MQSLPPTGAQVAQVLSRAIRGIGAAPWVTAGLLGLTLVSSGTWSGAITIPGGSEPAALSEAVERDLRRVAVAPHSIGSTGASDVRQYIVEQLSSAGLTPEIQQDVYITSDRLGTAYRAATVRNILARSPGRANTRALLLVAHYDSARHSPGAADNSAGVVALLEAMRAANSASHRNDVVVLFSDGEEIGLFGARVFLEKHRWARGIGVVLNFEARGNSGPATMFETRGDDGWLIARFARAVSRPFANSCAPIVYRRMPNNTDFSVFRDAKIAGMNFAFFRGVGFYHAPADTPEGLDRRSLNQHVSNATALAKDLGEADLTSVAREESVYFDVFGRWMVIYGRTAAVIGSGVIAAGFIGITWAGFHRRRLTPFGVLIGIIAPPLAALLTGMFCFGLMRWFVTSRPASIYAGDVYIAALVAAAVFATLCAYAALAWATASENLLAGALLWWVVLSVGSAWKAVGASYLFMWPAAGALVAYMAILLWMQGRAIPVPAAALLATGCIPMMIVWPPMILALYAALPFNGFIAAVVTSCVCLIVPAVFALSRAPRWGILTASAAVVVVLWAAAWRQAIFDPERPQASYATYIVNADTGSAVWAAFHLDKWTNQLLAHPVDTPPDIASLQIWYDAMPHGIFFGAAPAATIASPEISVLEDKVQQNHRIFRLLVRTHRRAPELALQITAASRIVRSSVQGRTLEQLTPGSSLPPIQQGPARPPRHVIVVTYFSPPEPGLIVEVETETPGPLRVHILDRSYELPAGVRRAPGGTHILPIGDTVITRTASF